MLSACCVKYEKWLFKNLLMRLARALKLEILHKLLCKVLETRKMVVQTSFDAFSQGLKARDIAQTAL